MTHNEETHMNLSWLWPKLVMPKSRSSRLAQALDRDLAELKAGSAGTPVRDDPFSEANLNKRLKRMHDKDRLDEIGKLAHQILVQKVASSNDHKRYQLNSRDVQEAWDSATDIYNLTRAHRAAVEKCHDEQAPVVRSFVQ